MNVDYVRTLRRTSMVGARRSLLRDSPSLCGKSGGQVIELAGRDICFILLICTRDEPGNNEKRQMGAPRWPDGHLTNRTLCAVFVR